MSYGIIDDGDEIHIRARITQRWELAELVAKLQQRVDGMPVDITTEHRPWQPYPEGDTIQVAPGTGEATATVTVKDGAITSVNLINPGQTNAYDAQDVNQRELKNE